MVGAALRFLATLVEARSVAEVGTGAGVSGVWLLPAWRGRRPDQGRVEAEHQRLARQTFAEAGFRLGRARLIPGRALDVLPRLADVCLRPGVLPHPADRLPRLRHRGAPAAAPRRPRHGRRGVGDGKVPTPRCATPRRWRCASSGLSARDDERLVPLLLPVGDGLLALQRR